MDHSLHRVQLGNPLLMVRATARQLWAAGRRELVRAEDAGVGHDDAEGQHGDERADEDAGELGEELFARVGAQQVAALEVGQQVGRGNGGAGNHVGAHQRGGGAARMKPADDHLRDLAHGADGRGVGLAGDAAGHQRQDERQHQRQPRQPVGHVERFLAR